MINLRTRLLVGYGYMMMLLFLTAGSAAFGFYTISEAIDRILEENFQSVSAAVEMLEELERQNILTMNALLDEEVPTEEFRISDRNFVASLEAAKVNITIDGEEEILAAIRENFEAYIALRDESFITDYDTILMEIFARRIFPELGAVRDDVSELLAMNHQAIIIADRDARDTALQMAGWLGFLVTLALFSMVFLARALQQKVLIRLRELSQVAEALLTGDHSPRFDTTISDELGLVSRQLNDALDERDGLQAEMRGRLNQQKQLVLGLLEEVRGDLLLLGLDGRLIASSCENLEQAILEPVRKWLVEHRAPILKDFREEDDEVEFSINPEGVPLHIRLLAADGRRPVGWLIRIVDPGKDNTCEDGKKPGQD